MFDLSEKDQKRLWSKIDVRRKNQCWPWTAKARSNSGYGILTLVNGLPGGRNVVASRLVCFLAHGAAPADKPHALHSCDNPSCCNPSHLRWGAPMDNVADAKRRRRHVNPPNTHANPEWNAKRLAAMPSGERVWNNTLVESDVRTIFRLHMERRNVSQIAEATGKPKHVIADICRGRSWRHLEGIPSLEELKQGGVRRGFNQFS